MSVTTRWKLFWKNMRTMLAKHGWIGFLILVLLVAGIMCWRNHVSHSGETVTLLDLSRAHEISACAPILPFRTGNVRVLYEGVISSDAKLEITSGQNRTVIPLPAGEVSGHYGGPEDWVGRVSVRYVPSGFVRGTLKITAVCGRILSPEEKEFYPKLNEQRRR